MKLLTVGDSFTYGEELAELTSAWPFLLGDRLGYEVNNLAKPGSGNTRMVRTVLENIDDFDLIIVAWSHYSRLEFADQFGIFDIWPGRDTRTFVDNLRYRGQLSDYLTEYHNDDYQYFQYLINIILMQDFFKKNNKRYLMIDAFGNDYNTFKTNDKIMKFRKKIDPKYYVGWPDDTMMEITYKLPKGPRGHFLEHGHQVVADKIYEHIRNLSWVS
jgi:hypothetical protein